MLNTIPEAAQQAILRFLAQGDFRGAKEILDAYR